MAMGRPRTFDMDKALDSAMKVFWKKGYEGSSLPDLTKAMGINRPSLYAAFGNKEALFRKVLDRYVSGPACHVKEALAAPTAREMAEKLLHGGADMGTEPGRPRGCLLVQSALACGSDADPLRREMAKMRAAGQAAIRERLERAIAEGDLPAGTNAADLARYLTVVMHGMAVHATSGATREELRRVATLAMESWPQTVAASRSA